jgi:rhodanese-related sulfurtransferase
MKPTHALGALAAVLALLAAVVGTSHRNAAGQLDVAALAGEIEHESDHVTAIDLAQWIRDRKPGLRVIDVRSDSEFADFHIATAEHIPLTALAKLQPGGDETLVLYSEGGAHAAQGWVLLRSLGFQKVYFLRGGLLDWMDDVMSPALADRTGNATSDSTRDHIADLSRYFGGLPHVGSAASQPSGSSASAVAKVKRRGC